MSFKDIIAQYDWDKISQTFDTKTSKDVELALSKKKRDLDDFLALISPAAAPYLEQMAQLSYKQTQKRFGKTVQLYIPLYLSNICENHCVYCGFNIENKIKRIVLNEEEIEKEINAIKDFGYEHILLVTGESPRKAGVDYLEKAIAIARKHFAQVSIEVQPLEQDEYERLVTAGLNSVYIYQETYNQNNYPKYHIKGKKADYDYRLETPDRLGKAGVYKIGIGTLIGLENWRTDAFFTALHLNYLEKTYWKSKYCISFPRLRPHQGSFQPNYPASDRELLQLICAYRLFNEEVELSISVRESATFRDNVIKLGITSMSAGSKTEPGGYSMKTEALEQFEVHDDRSPQEIAAMIKSQGYEAVWKDWDEYIK